MPGTKKKKEKKSITHCKSMGHDNKLWPYIFVYQVDLINSIHLRIDFPCSGQLCPI